MGGHKTDNDNGRSAWSSLYSDSDPQALKESTEEELGERSGYFLPYWRGGGERKK